MSITRPESWLLHSTPHPAIPLIFPIYPRGRTRLSLSPRAARRVAYNWRSTRGVLATQTRLTCRCRVGRCSHLGLPCSVSDSVPLDGSDGPCNVMGRGRFSAQAKVPDPMGLWRHGAVWILVLVAHWAFGWLITRTPSPQAQFRAPTGPLTVITLAPSLSKTAIAPSFPVMLLPISLTVPDLPAPGSVESEDDGAVMIRSSGLTVPPHPDETFTLDAATFARQAGLQGGFGVTVVHPEVVRWATSLKRWGSIGVCNCKDYTKRRL